MTFFFFTNILIFLLMILFFFFSKKMFWEKNSSSVFECGFSSYFFSRFSFSIHYFSIALIFLLLDLELCFLLPFFNQDYQSFMDLKLIFLIALVLIFGLLWEWKLKQLDWKF